MCVQEIPGRGIALRDISSQSILHFLRLTFLTPTNAALCGEYIRLALPSGRGFPSVQNAEKQSITRAEDVLEIAGKEVDKLIVFKWFTCVII